jgi:hypothetical protein
MDFLSRVKITLKKILQLMSNNPSHNKNIFAKTYLYSLTAIIVTCLVGYVIYIHFFVSYETNNFSEITADNNVALEELNNNIVLFNKTKLYIKILHCDANNSDIRYVINKLKNNLLEINNVSLVSEKSENYDFMIDSCDINILSGNRKDLLYINNSFVLNAKVLKNENDIYYSHSVSGDILTKDSIIDMLLLYLKVNNQLEITLNKSITQLIDQYARKMAIELIEKIHHLEQGRFSSNRNDSILKANYTNENNDYFLTGDSIFYSYKLPKDNHDICVYSKNYNKTLFTVSLNNKNFSVTNNTPGHIEIHCYIFDKDVDLEYLYNDNIDYNFSNFYETMLKNHGSFTFGSDVFIYKNKEQK